MATEAMILAITMIRRMGIIKKTNMRNEPNEAKEKDTKIGKKRLK